MTPVYVALVAVGAPLAWLGVRNEVRYARRRRANEARRIRIRDARITNRYTA